MRIADVCLTDMDSAVITDIGNLDHNDKVHVVTVADTEYTEDCYMNSSGVDTSTRDNSSSGAPIVISSGGGDCDQQQAPYWP